MARPFSVFEFSITKVPTVVNVIFVIFIHFDTFSLDSGSEIMYTVMGVN